MKPHAVACGKDTLRVFTFGRPGPLVLCTAMGCGGVLNHIVINMSYVFYSPSWLTNVDGMKESLVL